MDLFKPKIRSRVNIRTLPFPFLSRRPGTLFFLVLSFVLLIISALNPAAITGVRTSVVDFTAPFLKTVSIPIQSAALMLRDMTEISQLQAENTQLQEENTRLREWYQTALFLESENKSLRTLLNVKADIPQKFITARVIADSGNRFVKTLLVGAGRHEGVRKGQAVLSGKGMIGRVIEVGEKASRVLLLTDMNSRVPILVAGSNQHGILTGRSRGNPVLKHVNQESVIAAGSHIMTSGHGGVFPPGLPIGRVIKPLEGIYEVQLSSNLSQIVYVRIIDIPGNRGVQEIK